MRVIWKYQLEPESFQRIHMPIGAVIRHLGEQGDTPTLWVEVDPEETQKEYRTFYTYPTGAEVYKDAESYVGTILLFDGVFVAHVYEGEPETL